MTDQKIWLITGASRGFGRIWSEAALARGDKVAATARDLRSLADLSVRYGDAFLPLQLDVNDRDGVFEAVTKVHAYFGRLDVVVSNAGYSLQGAVEEVVIEDVRAIFETNVFGTLSVIQAALPFLRQQGSGHIIPVTSVSGLLGVPTSGIYASAKHAVEGMSETLAIEVAEFGIKVTIIEPGPYATEFQSPSSKKSAKPLSVYEAGRARFRSLITPDLMGDPKATVPAMLKLVDTENPPLRLMLGNSLGMVERAYAERMRTWKEWDDVAKAAQHL